MKNCVFCHAITAEQICMETENFRVILDIDPIQTGHLLILSKNHIVDRRELTAQQCMELMNLEKLLIEKLEQHFDVRNVSIIQNNGPIMDEGTHFHVHVIPRYVDDRFWDNQQVKAYALPVDELRERLRKGDGR